MFLDIHDLEIHPINLEETLPPGAIDIGREIKQVEPLSVEGTAELLASEIHLHGSLKTAVEVTCARCLEPIRRDVAVDFDLFYEPMQTIAKGEDVEIGPNDLDVGFYEGDGMLLEDALKEQILLALPMKNICQEDCRGLCPQCGQNRNLVNCGCHPPEREIHWAPLEKLDLSKK